MSRRLTALSVSRYLDSSHVTVMPSGMASRGVVVVFLFFLAFVSLAISWEYALVFFALAFISWYYLQDRCPSCRTRGSMRAAGSEVINQERAYGIVTRHETTTRKNRDSNGRVRYEDETTTRQERAPIVKATVRYSFKCKRCGAMTYRDRHKQWEDFSRDEEPAKEKTIIIQKEVVKVPCKYCGALNEIATQKTCSNCGAVIK